jgi:SAM-dependent MidA family methyltransferase
MRAQEKFGKFGDFYTSSDISAVFGRLLARQFDEIWRMLGKPARIELVELGPGRGFFAADVLSWSRRTFPQFAAALHITLMESSPSLRAQLADRFAGETCVSIVEQLPSATFKDAIVFANEFFDALPVEVVIGGHELRVDVKDGRFAETTAPARLEVLEFLDRYSVHPEADERVEVALGLRDWMNRIDNLFRRGFLVAIDYGYTRDEQLAGRHRDTLKAIRRHTISASPYEAPGEQDITADVNFTAMSEMAREFGLEPMPPVTQSQFLLGIGEANQLADVFEGCTLPQEHAKRAMQLKHLITPAGLGEAFHVLVMAKDLARSEVETLSGLSFGKR